MNIKKHSLVKVISGKYKNREGLVRCFEKSTSIIVKNVNLVKKHIRTDSYRQIKGSIITKENSLDISNVISVKKIRYKGIFNKKNPQYIINSNKIKKNVTI